MLQVFHVPSVFVLFVLPQLSGSVKGIVWPKFTHPQEIQHVGDSKRTFQLNQGPSYQHLRVISGKTKLIAYLWLLMTFRGLMKRNYHSVQETGHYLQH